MGTNEALHGVLISFHSVSQPVLSESLGMLLDVVVNFQPEVSCRVHAIVSKLCHFCSVHSLFIVFREQEKKKSSLSLHGMLGVFIKLF